jgi:hypothetical protein
VTNEPPIVARVLFSDRTTRCVYQAEDGRQFVIGNEGERVYGMWFIPRDEADEPVIVQGWKWRNTCAICASSM